MTTYVFGQKKQRVSVILYEEFTGDGSDVTFQLTSSPDNATWLSGHGAWAAGNIHTTYPAHITKTNKKPIYDSIIPLTRNRISVSSINASGLATLDYAPRNGVDFYIWYWYQLSTDDILSAYHRPDFIASMEGEMIGALNIYDTDSSNVLSIAWAEDSSNDRILNIAGLVGGDRTLTLYESFTIGDGHGGTITFSAASKVLTIDESETLSNYLTASRGDARYYTETEVDTWRNSVSQTEMGYLDGVTSDIQTQLDARCLESIFGTSIGAGLLLTATVLSVSAILQKYHAIDPSADVQSLLACANEAAIRTLLDLEAGTDFYSKSAEDTWRNSVTQTEMGYVNGVTSDIQTQMDAKAHFAITAVLGTL